MSVPRLLVAAVERVTAHIPALAASPHLLYAVSRLDGLGWAGEGGTVNCNYNIFVAFLLPCEVTPDAA